ncbi:MULTISPECIES: M13 family metallopeptidase [Hyphomonas]|uniref:Zinc metalloprotease n=1 Tax=Hyphomonas adhaerens TaxID=81029 RepID=A0A3B9GUE3_9PROT|nr:MULTISPECIES: M13 family metallopeptidase [Hyphomonas]MBB41273.1 zinc metalloprotease [Hyphomonas sp.]HAE25624.1 zinc metalloprotease [Hyphomonas adhaerens]
MKHLLIGTAAIALLAGCTPKASAPAENDKVALTETTPPIANADGKFETSEGLLLSAPDYWGSWGIDLSVQDTSVTPGNDFYAWTNGKWLDSFVIPSDRSRYGSFDLLAEKSEQRVLKIIDDLAAEQPAIDTPEGKIGAYYNAYLDTDAINAAGLAPAQPYLDRIKAVQSLDDLAVLFATPGFSSPVSGFVFADDKDPDTNIFQMRIGGLGLPDRDYYLKADDKSVELRAKYLGLLTFMLDQAGYEDAAGAAQNVLDLETEIAKADWDRALARNPDITYNKVSKDDLVAMAGDFPLVRTLDTMGVGGENEFLVAEIPPTEEELEAAGISAEDATKLGGGFPAMFQIASDTPLDTWKAYLTAHFLSDFASVLPKDIDDANFAFYGTALRGQPEQRERWKRAVQATQGTLGEAIGKVFVERYFPPENKAAMDNLVANLRKAMAANLEDLGWMSEATKVKAEAKLDAFTPKIGYPDEFETYDTLVVGNSALDNAIASQKWQIEDNLADLGQPVDRTRWFMTPQTINAYYNPSFNEIVFPAAILQPPFFNISADPAVNYGAIGGVIGHEMGHGFDDQGAKYDGEGVLTNWWTEEDLAAFRQLGDALAKQYSAYCPLDDGETCVNGRLTLGENIGDLGGLSLAYRAYQMSLDGKEAPVIDGLTGDQRFFMAWAQVWRAKYRDEAIRQQMLSDPHSPPVYRVNGVVRNLDKWYEAFDIQPGDALYLPPEERIHIW